MNTPGRISTLYLSLVGVLLIGLTILTSCTTRPAQSTSAQDKAQPTDPSPCTQGKLVGYIQSQAVDGERRSSIYLNLDGVPARPEHILVDPGKSTSLAQAMQEMRVDMAALARPPAVEGASLDPQSQYYAICMVENVN